MRYTLATAAILCFAASAALQASRVDPIADSHTWSYSIYVFPNYTEEYNGFSADAPNLTIASPPWAYNYQGAYFTYAGSGYATIKFATSSLAGFSGSPHFNARLNYFVMEHQGSGSVDLMHWSSPGPTPAVVLSGDYIHPGWKQIDVTSLVLADIADGRSTSEFSFAPSFGIQPVSTVVRFAASEDPQGRGAYISVVPEPATLLILGAGIPVLGVLSKGRRRR